MASMRSILKALQALLRLRIHLTGKEHLNSGRPTLFVCNHFTRMETAILPWVLYEHTGRIHASLAHDALFFGAFGKWLRAAQVIPTKEPGRNELITHDLITGKRDWVIYPEGGLVKNRKVMMGSKLAVDIESGLQPRFPHTGAAVIGLEAEVARRQLQHYRNSNQLAGLQHLREKFQLNDYHDCAEQAPQIIPVSMTYYPLRPGDNAILHIAHMLGGKDSLPRRLVEELSVEGRMLTQDTDLHIHLGAPIPMDSWVDEHLTTHSDLALGDKDHNAAFIDHGRWFLTEQFMRAIYGGTTVNFDHIFALTLRYLPHHRIQEKYFRHILLLSALELQRHGLALHPQLRRNIAMVTCDRSFEPYDSAMQCALADGTLRRDHTMLVIDPEHVTRDVNFHAVRMENPLLVAANEIEPVSVVHDVVRTNSLLPPEALRHHVLTALIGHDRALYREAYQRHQPAGKNQARKRSPSLGVRPVYCGPQTAPFRPSISH